jgi:hypothetical protein
VSKPPPSVLLAYRLVGWRVGPAHADWVLDDIVRRGWVIRQGLPALAGVMAIGGLLTGAVGGDANRLVTVVLVLAAAGLVLRNTLRARALRQQGIDASGPRLAEARWYDDAGARRRRNLGSAALTVVLVVAGLAILAVRSRG